MSKNTVNLIQELKDLVQKYGSESEEVSQFIIDNSNIPTFKNCAHIVLAFISSDGLVKKYNGTKVMDMSKRPNPIMGK